MWLSSIGIPFGVTIDFQTLLDNTVTVRDRDSMAQVRVSITALVPLLKALCEETTTWASVMDRYMVVKTGAEEEPEAEEGAAVAAVEVNTTSPTILQYTSRGSFTVPNPHYVKK